MLAQRDDNDNREINNNRNAMLIDEVEISQTDKSHSIPQYIDVNVNINANANASLIGKNSNNSNNFLPFSSPNNNNVNPNNGRNNNTSLFDNVAVRSRGATYSVSSNLRKNSMPKRRRRKSTDLKSGPPERLDAGVEGSIVSDGDGYLSNIASEVVYTGFWDPTS